MTRQLHMEQAVVNSINIEEAYYNSSSASLVVKFASKTDIDLGKY